MSKETPPPISTKLVGLMRRKILLALSYGKRLVDISYKSRPKLNKISITVFLKTLLLPTCKFFKVKPFVHFLIIIFSESSDKKFIFRRLKDSSVDKYSLVLHRLIFACVRYYAAEDWTSNYRYPAIDSSQSLVIKTLYDSIIQKVDDERLDKEFHAVCFALFAHQKHEYDSTFSLSSKFFSPVICFIVIHCITENGGTPNSSGITNVIAPIMYSIRATILQESLLKVSSERISTFQYVFFYFGLTIINKFIGLLRNTKITCVTCERHQCLLHTMRPNY